MNGPKAFARLCAALASAFDAENLAGDRTVVIQPHDIPDHDAVASATALSRLLEKKGFKPVIAHRGEVRSSSLRTMLDELGISMRRYDEGIEEALIRSPCVVVDGSPNNANAHPITSRLVGVVDHHPNPGAPRCAFIDIRTSYGACSTIIADYWEEADFLPDRDTATALLIGIRMDTDFLSRRVSPADLDAHNRLFFRADWEFSSRVVKASLSILDLPAFQYAVSRSRTRGCLFFTVVPVECSQELISIMADFFLRLKEISISVIVETGGDDYHVSARSRAWDISAAAVVKSALAGIGEGGGHDHMAGGVIHGERALGEDALFARFVAAVETAQENQ